MNFDEFLGPEADDSGHRAAHFRLPKMGISEEGLDGVQMPILTQNHAAWPELWVEMLKAAGGGCDQIHIEKADVKGFGVLREAVFEPSLSQLGAAWVAVALNSMLNLL